MGYDSVKYEFPEKFQVGYHFHFKTVVLYSNAQENQQNKIDPKFEIILKS